MYKSIIGLLLLTFSLQARAISIDLEKLLNYKNPTVLKSIIQSEGLNTSTISVKLKNITFYEYSFTVRSIGVTYTNQSYASFHLPQVEKDGKTISLDGLIPKHIISAIGTPPKDEFQNCHNTALNFYSYEPLFQYTPGLIMQDYAIKKKFKSLQKGDNLEFGTLISVFRNNEIVHSAIYIGDDIVLHKEAPGKEVYVGFTTLKEALRPYKKEGKEKVDVRFYKYNSNSKMSALQLSDIYWSLYEP